MRWQQGRRSSNVDDRRGLRPAKAAGGLGGGVLIVLLLGLLFGADPSQLLSMLAGGAGGGAGTTMVQDDTPRSAEENQLADFVSVVLADTEDVWGDLFPQAFGEAYPQPRLVMFTGQVRSACGLASAAMGPFYCPGDQQVYIDLSFYEEMRRRFGAPGDFAQAYVIAHEVGHHIQNLMGTLDQVHRMQQGMSKAEANALQVRVELQADFLAGVWAHHAQRARNILEAGDIEEALNAASAIGDDTLQKQAQGYAVPESFTHGTSAQRQRWFTLGFETGDLSRGDTFAAQRL
ncbi:MAG TPA: neutral zinc metallopeptidase [Candidatus Krumholzibacteria bacterium]|nr:neutral zinc metallopeptidase [Candidatus Krumholzibacteria bacterium]HRX51793.1 neutral zinc metallopeptidase [Candidatus Krumholzibacteria bacterium]